MDSDTAFADGTTLFRLLAECLQDEHRLNPGLCPLSFPALPKLVEGDVLDIPELRIQYHGLCGACMRNLTVPQTEAQRKQLYDDLLRSFDKCALDGPGRHYQVVMSRGTAHLRNEPVELFDVVLCLCLLVSNCLYDIDTSSGSSRTIIFRARRPHKHVGPSKGTWPSRVDQLFPYGFEQTVKALAAICFWLPVDSPLRILNAVLHLARPRVWPFILEYENILGLSFAIVSMTLYGTRWRITSIQLRSQDSIRERERPPIRDAAWLRSG